MKRKIKNLLLVVLATALSIPQLNTVCKAKLKPGQFNKEILKWIEPYKERDGIPDSWTWYPEYDSKENDGTLPKGAVITNETDEETKDVFYDEYWVNDTLWGGMNQIYHNKDVGLTKPMLGIIGRFLNKSRLKPNGFIFITDKDGMLIDKAEEVWGSFVSRQVTKTIDMYTGNIKVGILAIIKNRKGKIMDINVYLTLYRGSKQGSSFEVTSEYLNDFEDFSYESLEKALDKFSKVCYNYDSYIGSSNVVGVPSERMDYDSVCGWDWISDKSLYSKKFMGTLDMWEKMKKDHFGGGIKALDIYSKAYSNFK